MHDPPPRTRPPEERRTQILDAATSVLLESGAGRTTIDRVARKAGVAKGTVYLYFESKDALFAALRTRYDTDLLAAAGEELGADGDHGDRLTRFLSRSVELNRHRADLHHELFREIGGTEDATMDRLRFLLAGWIADGVRAGRFTVTDTELAAGYVLHALHGVLVDHLHGDGRGDEVFVERVVETTMAALGDPPDRRAVPDDAEGGDPPCWAHLHGDDG